jgi:hypothetical protein
VCPYCSKPIESIAALEVEHVIPETLAGHPARLKDLLGRLGVPDLQINSYRNWLPVHGRPCNRNKEDTVYSDTTLLNYLELARKREPHVLEEERKILRQARNRDALAPLIRLIEVGELSKEEAISIVEKAKSSAHKKSEPLVLGFGVNLDELIDSGRLPEEAPAPPMLYDWLERELEQALRNTGAVVAKPLMIENERNGESVSVRFAFWLLDLETLPRTFPFAWELLEVAPFSEIYPDESADDLFANGIIAKHQELILDENSTDPLPYKRCPNCGSSALKRVTQMHREGDIHYVSCECGWGERF